MVKILKEEFGTEEIIDGFRIYKGFDLCGYCGDKNATSFTIPECVTSIDTDALSFGCSHVTSIHLPSHLKSIGDGAFQGCDSLEEITIPKSVEFVWCDAFCYCKSLKRVYVLSDNLKVGRNLFYMCPNNPVVIYNGIELTIDDFDVAFQKHMVENSDYEEPIDFKYVIEIGLRKEKRRLQDERDVASGIRSVTMIEDENDFGF